MTGIASSPAPSVTRQTLHSFSPSRPPCQFSRDRCPPVRNAGLFHLCSFFIAVLLLGYALDDDLMHELAPPRKQAARHVPTAVGADHVRRPYLPSRSARQVFRRTVTAPRSISPAVPRRRARGARDVCRRGSVTASVRARSRREARSLRGDPRTRARQRPDRTVAIARPARRSAGALRASAGQVASATST